MQNIAKKHSYARLGWKVIYDFRYTVTGEIAAAKATDNYEKQPETTS